MDKAPDRDQFFIKDVHANRSISYCPACGADHDHFHTMYRTRRSIDITSGTMIDISYNADPFNPFLIVKCERCGFLWFEETKSQILP